MIFTQIKSKMCIFSDPGPDGELGSVGELGDTVASINRYLHYILHYYVHYKEITLHFTLICWLFCPWTLNWCITFYILLFYIVDCPQREQRRGVRADLQPGLGDPGEPPAGGGQGHGGQPAEPRRHQAQECHGRGWNVLWYNSSNQHCNTSVKEQDHSKSLHISHVTLDTQVWWRWRPTEVVVWSINNINTRLLCAGPWYY